MQSDSDLGVAHPTEPKQFNLERFFNLTPDILCIAGYDGYLKKVNPALIKLLGYSEQELMQAPIRDFVYREDQPLTDISRTNLKEQIPLLDFTNRYVTKSGELVWLSWTSIAEPKEEVIYAIAKDITHVKKLEEERNRLLLNLSELNGELKKFGYTTSHDLRAPVNNIIALLDLMEDSEIDNPEILEYLKHLKSSALHMETTLNGYVDAISNEHSINVPHEVISLDETLSEIQNAIHELIKKTNTSFVVDFSEAPIVKFSCFYLQSIFLNLISNAIKYRSPDRAPLISIQSKIIKDHTELIFTDNGLGFNMTTVGEQVFGIHQRFHHHENSKGIGLYLVQTHMKSMGGNISVHSEENIGTTFTLTFKN